MSTARLFEPPAGRWAVALAVLLLLVVTLAACATTPSQDYRFDVVPQPVKVGPNSDITVRLVHLPSGQAVKNAIISEEQTGNADELARIQTGRALGAKSKRCAHRVSGV